MFRIRKVLDNTSSANREAIKQVLSILSKQFPAARKEELIKLPQQLNDSTKHECSDQGVTPRLLRSARNDSPHRKMERHCEIECHCEAKRRSNPCGDQGITVRLLRSAYNDSPHGAS